MFDTGKVAGINSNVHAILHDVGAGKSSFDRTHADEAVVLLRFGVIVWKGDATLASNATKVLNEVASHDNNLDRQHARDADKAMSDGSLSIVAG